MKNADSLGYAGRHRLLAPAIDEVFHLRLMTRLVAGRRHWKGFSKTEKESFVDAFSGLVAATYADRFDGYSGQSFEILGSTPLRPKTVLVKTSIVGPKRTPTRLNYVLREFRDGWHAVDRLSQGFDQRGGNQAVGVCRDLAQGGRDRAGPEDQGENRHAGGRGQELSGEAAHSPLPDRRLSVAVGSAGAA